MGDSEEIQVGTRGSDDLDAEGARRCIASDVAVEVTTDAVRLLGSVKNYLVERMMRGVKITQVYEGIKQFQRVVVACQLLK